MLCGLRRWRLLQSEMKDIINAPWAKILEASTGIRDIDPLWVEILETSPVRNRKNRSFVD